MESAIGGAQASHSAAAAGEEVLGLRLRDLLLRFPCALLDGVRWSVLRKVYKERFPAGPEAPQAALLVTRTWLADVVEFSEGKHGKGEVTLHLQDAAGLIPGCDGQLACWPLLVQRLVEIVRSHGGPQHPHALEVPHEDCREEEGLGTLGSDEVIGVLLAQLKPLLKRYWDPSFEERAVGFFNETGQYVSVKKMKHLISALLGWRCQRRALARERGHTTAVDAALSTSIFLATSQRHNDMVLCCPRWQPAAPVCAATPREPQKQLAPRDLPPKIGPLMDYSEVQSPDPGSYQGTGFACESPRRGSSDAFEKESRRLRIENAELKKRLRFDSEFLHKELRRLRIENAELKKRLFFFGGQSHEGSRPAASTHVQQFWLSTPAAVLTPVMHSPGPQSPVHAACSGTPPAGGQSSWGCAMPAGTLPSSGNVSPTHGSITPTAQGFCYAPPFGAGVVHSHAWASSMGPYVVAVPIGAASAFVGDGSASKSPFSDLSQQERLLPKSLLGSDPSSTPSSHASLAFVQTSSHVSHSEGVSPEHPGHAQCGSPTPVSQLIVPDHWVCIPSGIVERHKAQFEGPLGTGDCPVQEEGMPANGIAVSTDQEGMPANGIAVSTDQEHAASSLTEPAQDFPPQ